jgi:hypothetical protein
VFLFSPIICCHLHFLFKDDLRLTPEPIKYNHACFFKTLFIQ